MPSRRQQKLYEKQLRENVNRKQNPETYVNQAPFRYAERNFKSRFPPPDYSQVIDFHSSQNLAEAEQVRLAQSLQSLSSLFGDSDQTTIEAFILKRVPGLIVIPNPFSPQAQRRFIRECLSVYARAPHTSNLDTHYQLPAEGLWQLYEREQRGEISENDPEYYVPRKPKKKTDDQPVQQQRRLLTACDENFRPDLNQPKPDPLPSETVPILPPSQLLKKMRWVMLGYQYHWPTRTYHFDRRYKMPDPVAELTRAIVTALEGVGGPGGWINTYPGRDFKAEAAVINFYQYRDTLMGHVDRSELNMQAPLVSISFGNACIYLIGGKTRETEPVPIRLHSGDIVIMTEVCRQYFHGVPRILEDTLPDYLSPEGTYPDAPDWKLYGDYMRTSRINLNIRQVFPSENS